MADRRRLIGTRLAPFSATAAPRALVATLQKSQLTDTMASRDSAHIEITPEVLLKAYSCGIYPMAENTDDPALYWIEPELRGIIPLFIFYLQAQLRDPLRRERDGNAKPAVLNLIQDTVTRIC